MGYNSILSLFILLLKMIIALATGNSIRLAPVSSWHGHPFVSTSIVSGSQDGPGTSYNFLAPALESTFCPNSLGFFYCRMVFRNQISMPGVLITTRVSLFLGPLSRQNQEYVYIYYLHKHTYLYFFYNYLSILKTMQSYR